MRSTRVMADATGADIAQHLRVVVSDLWHAMGEGVLREDPRERGCHPVAPCWGNTHQNLAASEHVFVAYRHRITRVLHHQVADDVPFLGEPHLPRPPVSDELGVEVLLLRVSQEVECFARLLEALQPEDWDRKWRSEQGLSTVRQLVEEALALMDTHLQAAALSARMTLHGPSSKPRGRKVRSGPSPANDIVHGCLGLGTEMSRWP